jgi:glycosyltransferase involved in cell wall biosynthesis
MMKTKYAFIRVWASPPIAASVIQMLAEAFPEYDPEMIVVGQLLSPRRDILVINTLFMIWEYGLDILQKKKTPLEAFWGTSYIFKQVRKLLVDFLSPRKGNYAFTFQLQSLFDASLPGLSHFVYTDRTLLANYYYPGFDRRKVYSDAWVELERSIYQNATRVFTRSSDITRSLLEQYSCPPEKVACVYVGSNVHMPEGEPQNDNYQNQNILMVGTNWELKGGPALVDAFKNILKTHPQARLTIVGCSPVLDTPNVNVVGLVPVDEVANYYREASIFCLPTTWEAFGVAFIEAMAHKLPIVATNIAAIPDFVLEGESGHLIQPGDVDGLTTALLDLLNNPEKCRLYGEEGYRLVQERYNWKIVAAEVRKNVLADVKVEN